MLASGSTVSENAELELSRVFGLCPVLPPSTRESEVCSACRTRSQTCIFIFTPKPAKRVPVRNMLRAVWDWGFFQWKRRIPQLKRSHTSGFPFCFYRNLASIWLHRCDFSFLQLFFHGFLLGAGQKPSQPSVLFPLCSYPSETVAPLTTSLSHKGPHRAILRRWAHR